jgi:hypothetical protein
VSSSFDCLLAADSQPTDAHSCPRLAVAVAV